MKTDRLVTFEKKAGIAIVSLNRPQRHNALIPGLLTDLLDSFKQPACLNAPAVILRAEGRSFSTGGDLAGFQQHRETIEAYSQNLVGLLNNAILAIYSHPAPVVCSVDGQVTGGSLGLLLASDRVIMRRGVSITPYYSAVGFSPDGGWTALLPYIIGRQPALNWIANNHSHGAETCLDLGLAHEVVESHCDEAALSWAQGVAKMQADSISLSRRLLNSNIGELRRRLEAEREAFVKQIQSQQALDGIDQFLRRDKNV